jgi:Na+-translocating ferredoxin:NAD+ oxidoreductase subunit D
MAFVVETSPSQKSSCRTSWLMKQVVIALIPVVAVSVYFFRVKALLLIGVCVLSCLLSEYLVFKLQGKPCSLRDYSALVTGLLLALILPPSVSLGTAFLGGVVAIVIGKQVFGGLGKNIFNPALTARAFLMAAFPVMLTTWVRPFSLDAVTEATPLALWKFNQTMTSLRPLVLGNVSGSLGETSGLAIMLAGIYLIVRKVADWRAPLAMLSGTVFLTLLLKFTGSDSGSVLFHIFSGGFLLGLVFMVTDPVTTPVTKKGRLLFGFLTGLLIVVIRQWAGLPEGVMYSILFMNACVPLINKVTRPKPFGH